MAYKVTWSDEAVGDLERISLSSQGCRYSIYNQLNELVGIGLRIGAG